MINSTKSISLDPDKAWAKVECESSNLAFTRYFFKHRQNIKFRVNWHHQLMSDTLEEVIKGNIKNVIFNVPPGGSKTETCVINFIARGLALNPRSRFLHLSYADELALLNSQTARDLVMSEEYQALWPLQIATDAKAKGRWNVLVDDKIAGGVYATSFGGQITGFRAGHMTEGFCGAIIVDDPVKPEDAFSKPKMNATNRKFLTTVKSRRANPDTPIIVIMQRVSDNDPTAFILNGNLPGEWHHVLIPALIDEKYFNALAPKYQAMIEQDIRDEFGRFSYWQYKEPLHELLSMERGEGTDLAGSRMSRHVYASQYAQNPVAIGGNVIKSSEFVRYKVLPVILRRKIFADTAQKTKEHNDYSVFECWGLGADNRLYLLDMIRGKWEAPELRKRAVAFWNKHKGTEVILPWVDNKMEYGPLREMMVEDKSSGTGLIQDIRMMNMIPIKPIQRNIDKLTRVMDVTPYIESSMVCIPENAPFTADFIAECESFTADNSHLHDDQIDPMCDAITDMLAAGNKIRIWEQLGQKP